VSVVMPKLGNTSESAIILTWRKQAGETINEGDVLAEIETDKAIQEVTSPASGVLLETLYAVGADVPVMAEIARIGTANESKAEPARRPAISPRARNLAAQSGISIEQIKQISGTGPNGRIIERDVRAAQAQTAKMTPLAQAKIRTGEFSAPERGTGIGGRITTKDLIPAAAPVEQTRQAETQKQIPLSGVRKVIAARMVESLRSTAQLTMHMSADARALQAYRKRLKTSGKAHEIDYITINDMVMYTVSRTLPQFPYMNALLKEGAIWQMDSVDLAFAVDTPRGLLVPVIRAADKRTLKDLAAESNRLAEACQKGTIKPHELEGGTFTVTNLGSLGIEMFTPILNPPQVGILGVGAILPMPVDIDGETQFIPHIGLSLTIDHQAVDGAPGARFLQALAHNIAQFDLLLTF
ncbi:MAG: 2-oxo acid dehydrogenase subunit E2, partial [Phototrophicales bacterium]